MLSNKVLRFIDRLLRDLCNNDTPFGGKVLLLGGDWKQLAPVVENGVHEDTIKESIKMDPLFQHFQKLRLTMNMRTAEGEKDLCNWLQLIGNGLTPALQSHPNERPTFVVDLKEENVLHTLDEAIDFCFDPRLFVNPLQYSASIGENAILCPTNKEVQALNDKAMEKLKGETRVFKSIDQPLQVDPDWSEYRSNYNLEDIHDATPSGIPPHVLKLKVGAPIMLIRNMDVSRGLCNGTRMQIKKITDSHLTCSMLTGPRADANSTYMIPKVMFEYGRGAHHRGIRFKRYQFPIRPCFAMTVNKAQGQTLKKMSLILPKKQCFAHGQVYVAMSRVTTMDGIRVFSPLTCRGHWRYIQNMVYKELLDENVTHTDSNVESTSFHYEPITDPNEVDPDDFIFD